MTKPLIVIGTGPFAEIAAVYFDEYTDRRVAAFACHARYRTSENFSGRPLLELEMLHDAHPPSVAEVFVAIGYGKMNSMREAVYHEVRGRGYTCASFVHPDVKIWPSTKLGDNVFIFEDNTVQPFTTIGSDTILWSGNHIGHHSTIGSHCFISSHVVISGGCRIGDNVFIGVNATLRDGLTLGDRTLVGAGAILMRDTVPKEAYVPARTKPHEKNSEELGF